MDGRARFPLDAVANDHGRLGSQQRYDGNACPQRGRSWMGREVLLHGWVMELRGPEKQERLWSLARVGWFTFSALAGFT